MDIRQITYFMLVYEEKSVSRAAAKAKVAQPAVSMQIKHLEEEFGFKLFERTQSGVEPTRHAARFYRHCIGISRSFSLAQQEMRDIGSQDNLGGSLRIGLPGSVTRGLLTRILSPFLISYPDVDVTISEAYTGTLVEWVKSGTVDFAVGARPQKQRGLMQRLLYRDGVVVMSGTPLNGPNFAPIDLTKEPGLKLILPSANQSYGGFVRERIANGTIKSERVIEINGTVSSAEFARTTDWGVVAPFVAVVNEVAQEDLQNDLYIYPVVKPKIPFDLYLVYDERKPLTPAAKKFIERIELEMKWLKTVWETLKIRSGDDRL
ncbi:LysR family transcriptional regulator [Bradyrhizobium liaoningense]